MHFKSKLKSSNQLIDLTPLVDVIFLMLIFFIITANILPLKSLRIENPSLNKDTAPLTTQLLIVMDAQHVIYAGSAKAIVDFESLRNYLENEISVLQTKHPDIQPTIVLSIDKQVEYGIFFKLLAIAREYSTNIRLVYHYAET